jgi:hypothetical protein
MLALLFAGCIPHRASGPSPVKCPPAPAPDTLDARLVGHVSLDSHPSPLVRGPYTVVLDDHIVALVHNADPHAAANVLRGIDPATIESIEMVRSDHGDLMRIRRCHASTTH